MSITPVNNHLVIQPLARVSVISSHDKNYDEKGTVLSSCKVGEGELIGKVVYFDAWEAARYNEGTPDEFWLIPAHAIRAYE